MNSPCPQVIIELCSKHLDTECRGPDTEGSPPGFAGGAGPGPPSSPPPPPAILAPASSLVSDEPLPGQQQPDAECENSGEAALPSKAAVAEMPAMDAPDGLPRNSADGAGVPEGEEDNSSAVAQSPPVPKAAATTATASSAAAASRRRSSRGPPAPPLEGGRRGQAVATMTTCPVCGKHVRADLCSLHLDTDCTGVNPAVAAAAATAGTAAAAAAAPPPDEGGGKSKTSGVAGGDDKGDGGGGGAESGEVAPTKGPGAEAAGGLNALAAELTCPVW